MYIVGESEEIGAEAAARAASFSEEEAMEMGFWGLLLWFERAILFRVSCGNEKRLTQENDLEEGGANSEVIK